MAIENLLFSLVVEAPALMAIGFLQRRLGWSKARAETVVIAFYALLVLSVCLMTWFFYQRI